MDKGYGKKGSDHRKARAAATAATAAAAALAALALAALVLSGCGAGGAGAGATQAAATQAAAAQEAATQAAQEAAAGATAQAGEAQTEAGQGAGADAEALAAAPPASGVLSPEVEDFVVIYPENEVGCPVVAIAKALGYFEEEGLAPEYIRLSTGTMEALILGKADVNLFGIIPALSYGAEGEPVKIIGGMASGGNYFIARAGDAEALRDFENWRGKRVAVTQLSTSEMVLRYALGEERGFDLDKDIELVIIEDYNNIIEAVRKGEVDIGSIASEYGQAVRDLGLDILFPMTALLENYVCCRTTVSANALAEKRSAFVKFLVGEFRGYKYMLENPDEVVALLAKSSLQTEEFVRNIVYNKETNADRTFHPDPNLSGVRNIFETLRAWDYIADSDVTTEDIVDLTPYRDALAIVLERYPGDPVYLELKETFERQNS